MNSLTILTSASSLLLARVLASLDPSLVSRFFVLLPRRDCFTVRLPCDEAHGVDVELLIAAVNSNDFMSIRDVGLLPVSALVMLIPLQVNYSAIQIVFQD